MEEETKSKRFYYAAAENGSPLDYSFLEITDKWKADIPRGKGELKFRWDSIVDCTKKSVLFSKVFPQKHSASGSQKSEKTFTPILVEEEAFFRDYILTIMNSSKPKMKDMRNSNNRELPENFGVDFFKNARNSIKNSSDFLAYYEKMLYRDPTFQSYAAKYYWEAEFDRRCRLLKNTVLKCSPDLRLNGLTDILTFLDTEIGVFASLANHYQEKPESQRSSASSQKASQKFIERIPLSLCSLRKKRREKQGRLCSYMYCFNDIQVDIDQEETRCLSDIFRTLKPNFSPKEQRDDKDRLDHLREAARKAYLISLSKEVPECDFLIQAHGLDKYLQASSVQYALDDVIPLIKEIARQYLSHLINHTDYQSFTLQNIPVNATTSFLCGVICHYEYACLNDKTSELRNLPSMRDEPMFSRLNPDLIHPEDYHRMESPELFCTIFEKYIGRDFSDCVDYDPQRTYLELLVDYYYQCLFELEYSALDGTDKENAMKEFWERHSHRGTLDLLLHEEWNVMMKSHRNSVEQYLNDSVPSFPLPDLYLHRVFMIVKLFAGYRHVIEIAERCYKQYQIEALQDSEGHRTSGKTAK